MAKRRNHRTKRIPSVRSTRAPNVVPQYVFDIGIADSRLIMPATVPDVVPASVLSVVTPPSTGVLARPPVHLLNLPVETLSRIVTSSFCADFRARFNLMQTSKSMHEIVRVPFQTRRFAIQHWGNCTHAIMRIERRRLKARDSCDGAFLDAMNDIAAGLDYEDAAEVERLRKCPSYLFIETVLAPVRMHLATFAIAILVLNPEEERLTRYHEIRELVIPFFKELALWKGVHAHTNEYRRHTNAYLSILRHHRGNVVWFQQAVLADSYLLGDPSVTARIVELGGYKHFEHEKAKKAYAETEYRCLDSYRTGKTGAKGDTSAQSNNTAEQIKELREKQRLHEQRLINVEGNTENNSQTLTRINEAKAAQNEQIQGLEKQVADISISVEARKKEIIRVDKKHEAKHTRLKKCLDKLEVDVRTIQTRIDRTVRSDINFDDGGFYPITEYLIPYLQMQGFPGLLPTSVAQNGTISKFIQKHAKDALFDRGLMAKVQGKWGLNKAGWEEFFKIAKVHIDSEGVVKLSKRTQ